MKKESLKKYINNKIWIILLIVFGVRLVIYQGYIDFSIYPDTVSYMDFNANILNGEIDVLRTPVYSYIIKLVKLFANTQTQIYYGITIVQEIISIISVIVLYKTLNKEFKNKSANYFATILYGCSPVIFTYNKVILTESLSLSLFVIYFCLIIKYIKMPSNAKTLLIGVLTLLLIMLRPAFIYILVMLVIMFGLIFILKKEHRKQAILGMFVLVVIIGIILGYCYLNKKQNNIFAISNVTQINQLDTVIEMGIYDTGVEEDKGIINIINQRLDGFFQTWYRNTTDKIMEEYTPEQIDSFLNRCIKNNSKYYIENIIQKALKLPFDNSTEIYLEAKNPTMKSLMIPFGIIYLYLLVEAIYILIKIIKYSQLPLEQFIMFITILGQLGTIIIGAQAEYSRLFIPVLPIIIISMSYIIEEMINLYNSIEK